MKINSFLCRNNSFSKLTFSFIFSATFSVGFIPSSIAETKIESQVKLSGQTHNIKADLMAKLSQIQYINAEFSQTVVSDLGETLQKGKGTIAISKPDLVNWHTTEPDETLIVSNGKNLWFYDPFIEQVSIYSFVKSIANTPVLLLTSEDPSLWNNFQVSQNKEGQYLIKSLTVDSQIKSLTLTFENEKISQLSILDSTGQISHIHLLNIDFTTKPDNSLFDFVIPEGVMLDDQR
ncbi:outer membrane lipoprotein chaperone LolA [Thalassotalea profundi]|uniref:Outer-membrane lipoprotein carrier protein n=1 Tax=Thalassotalea profundi TaxID=2036687 RepID=A0ABQ3IGD0_9GAMM|nr:outer membrane lipoprotein chaperone LolA [Thalassotalea profundi]GHE82601.1 outer-membrane lipoprotein carrier protein [Thalassotalea profundi]